jgi:hypothetical protein
MQLTAAPLYKPRKSNLLNAPLRLQLSQTTCSHSSSDIVETREQKLHHCIGPHNFTNVDALQAHAAAAQPRRARAQLQMIYFSFFLGRNCEGSEGDTEVLRRCEQKQSKYDCG